MSEANRDDAERCLKRAQDARARGDFATAKRLAEKSRSLYPCAEVRNKHPVQHSSIDGSYPMTTCSNVPYLS